MKHLTTFLAATLLVGCASQQAEPKGQAVAVPLPSTSSSALAFDPPITQVEGQPDLTRETRGQAALVGFEEPTASVYGIATYNQQSGLYSGYYDKTSFSVKTGVTHR